jgi:hypothetical protein
VRIQPFVLPAKGASLFTKVRRLLTKKNAPMITLRSTTEAEQSKGESVAVCTAGSTL